MNVNQSYSKKDIEELLRQYQFKIFNNNNPKKRSSVWNSFGIIGKSDENGTLVNGSVISGYVACKKCFKVYTHKSNKGSGTSNIKSHVCKSEQKSNDNDINEVNYYMNLQFSLQEKHDYNDNPLIFWKKFESKMPILSMISKSIFVIQSSSAASERVFSKSGEIIQDKRTNLNTEIVSSMLFLNTVKNCLQ